MESLQNLPADGNDDALHDYLQRGIAEIHNNPEAQLPMNIYMNLYSATWRLTYRHKSDGSNTRNTNLYTFPSGIIYRNLSNFLADHLHLVAQRITSQDSSVLLQAYLTEWERYVAAAKRVDHLLNLINRHWIRRYVDEGNREVYFIHTLHCVQWRDHLWNRICDDVVNSAQQVMQKGDGDAAKAHDLLENFASLHIDEAIAATDEEMKIRKSLEAPFVSEIEAHHKIIDEAIDERNSIPIGIPVEGSVQ